ncbi:MAG: GNAT family N-acetyltransferase [Pirellulales bacterium]|nr:GNAT family N-acetyltransferase [Pirellulales bacterium]
MTEDLSLSPVIVPVPPEDKPRALALIFHHLAPKDREEQIESILFTPLSGGNCAAGLLGAYRENELVGAIFAHLQPGKTAQVWLPRLISGETTETALQLLLASNSWLAQNEVELAQMLFEQITEAEEQLLFRGGYHYLTDLLYLACLPDEFPTIRPETALEFLPYETSLRESLKNMIDATYRNSLDCPKLNDLRNMEAVLEGYRSSGVFRPELWSLVRWNSKDVGCLILADHPEFDNVELVYMGVAPWARGRGWGMQIARFAQWQTRGLDRARLVLAVDAENGPAIAMYSAVGLHAWDRRRVYFWEGGRRKGEG